MRRRNKTQQTIGHRDIETAVQQFLSRGGKINCLPDQRLYVPTIIGGEVWQAYENISDISF